MPEQIRSENIISDLLRPIRLNKSFVLWMGFLGIMLVICLYAYSLQLKYGLSVTGLGDYVSWGIYIANFVFFVATSLIGMLISAVLGLSGAKWASPLARIAEIIAFAFAAVAGLVIISDMGHPERLLNVFFHGRIQSPIVWDVTVISVYMVISALLLYLPLIPDMMICHDKVQNAPKMLKKLYRILSLNWNGSTEQERLIKRSTRMLAILIVPVALAIHTVTSWLFASTSRVGWDSTIFGPYFVTGAFVSGCAAVIIAMFFYRKSYKLHNYITDMHFDRIGKFFVLLCLVYLYFNLNEFMVPGYKMKKFDSFHLHDLFAGSHALMFWSVQIIGLIVPVLLLLLKKMRKPLPMLLIAMAVLAGAWFKRYIIVIPTQEHPYLPIQNVPLNFKIYSPTFTEILITIAPIILVLIIVTILSKLFPVIPVHETLQQTGVTKEEN